MVQIRYNFFETNSSSTCTLSINIVQVEHLNIPPVVKIETTDEWWSRDLNGCYSNAKSWGDEDAFIGLLKHVGVKEIYIDDKLVEGEFENYHTKFRDERIVLAICFGNYKSYGESQGHGGEAGESYYLSKKEIKEIQDYNKNPDYILICTHGDDDDTEFEWSSLPYSRMKITEQDIIEDERKKELYRQWQIEQNKEEERRYQEWEEEYYRKHAKSIDDNYEDKEYEKEYNKRFMTRKHRKEQY